LSSLLLSDKALIYCAICHGVYKYTGSMKCTTSPCQPPNWRAAFMRLRVLVAMFSSTSTTLLFSVRWCQSLCCQFGNNRYQIYVTKASFDTVRNIDEIVTRRNVGVCNGWTAPKCHSLLGCFEGLKDNELALLVVVVVDDVVVLCSMTVELFVVVNPEWPWWRYWWQVYQYIRHQSTSNDTPQRLTD